MHICQDEARALHAPKTEREVKMDGSTHGSNHAGPAMTSFALTVLLILGADILFPLRDVLTEEMITNV
jgi:hypothetical protein